tara:strand:+ start:763 stop:921 length:159 start_codon:yes stop_codon:yes gene_type:complete
MDGEMMVDVEFPVNLILKVVVAVVPLLLVELVMVVVEELVVLVLHIQLVDHQ